MSEITFHHPAIKNDLTVNVKPNEIVWAYGLNTVNYPTFGGEVVQILSIYVDDLSISGEVTSYREMEMIYKWFIDYMQKATQGNLNDQGFDSRPIKMTYHHRNWHFSILPKNLPALRYGTDVVAPTWALSAAVSEFDDRFQDSVLSNKDFTSLAVEDGFEPFGTVTAEIGYMEQNPWSSPTTKQYQKGDVTKWNDQSKHFYGGILQSWLTKGDFKSLKADYSVPKWMQVDNTK